MGTSKNRCRLWKELYAENVYFPSSEFLVIDILYCFCEGTGNWYTVALYAFWWLRVDSIGRMSPVWLSFWFDNAAGNYNDLETSNWKCNGAWRPIFQRIFEKKERIWFRRKTMEARYLSWTGTDIQTDPEWVIREPPMLVDPHGKMAHGAIVNLCKHYNQMIALNMI